MVVVDFVLIGRLTQKKGDVKEEKKLDSREGKSSAKHSVTFRHNDPG